MARNPYLPATAFAHALRSYQTGGLTFSDLMDEITTLLEDGASPRLLLETLERRSAIEPLAEGAYAEVSGVLTAAVARHGPEAAADTSKGESGPGAPGGAPGGASVSVLVQPEVSSSAARARMLASELAAARDALDAEEKKVRDLGAALTEHTAAARAATVRTEEARRELSQAQAEVRTLRDALTAREASLAEATYSLGQRDSQLSSLQQEHSRTVPALEARAAALAADLAVSRSALEAEQVKARESHKILTAQLGSADAVRSRNAEAVREAEVLKQELRTLQGSLTKRDAEHSELLQDHAKSTRALEERLRAAAQLEGDLQAAREHATGLAGELGSIRTELESERRRLQETQKSLSDTTAAARARTEAAAREADQLRHEMRLARESSKAREAELTVRASELAALRQAHAKAERALETSNKNVGRSDGELRAERARVEGLSTELAVTRESAAALDAQLKLTTSQLQAVRGEYDALKAARLAADAARVRDPVPAVAAGAAAASAAAGPGAVAGGAPIAPVAPVATAVSIDDSGVLLAKLASFQKEFDATDSFIARMRSDETDDPVGVTAPQPLNRERERAARARSAEPVAPVAPPAAPPADSHLLQRVRARPGRPPPTIGRAAGWGAAVLLLGVALWAVVHDRASRTPTAELAAPAPGTVIRDCPECPAMKVLPAARFKQGAARTDSAASAFEKPQHWVGIARPFAVSIDAITVDEFARFIAATGRPMEGCDTYDGDWQHRADGNWRNPGFVQSGRHPVTCVSFDDATAYAQWLSERTGRRYRLPSASEWEYAAGGTEAASPWGRGAESTACSHANVADQSAARRYPGWRVFPCDDGYPNTSPVGSFKGNVLGLNDMLGNVFQWTEDCWTADYSDAPVDGRPRTDGDCAQRELRGGSWFSPPAYVRLSYRNHFAADYRTSSAGIRLVRETGS